MLFFIDNIFVALLYTAYMIWFILWALSSHEKWNFSTI